MKHTKDKFSIITEYFKKYPEQLEIDENESVIMDELEIEYSN